jgi:hypothetical protein
MTADEDPAPVADAVRDYYEALRRGEPLYPYFLEAGSVAKFGVSESLLGYDEVAEGLREQTRVTDGWTVDSRRLTAGRAGSQGWFSDRVALAWNEGDERRSHDTRWSGSLRRRDGEWVFAELHVSVAHATGTDDAGGGGA